MYRPAGASDSEEDELEMFDSSYNFKYDLENKPPETESSVDIM